MSKLEIKDLSISYHQKCALSGVSLSFREGRIYALLGPSGCGKSSLLYALNRLHDLNPDARVTGQVLVDSIDVYHPKIDVLALRRQIGLIFQRPNPFPFTIFENIAFALREHGVPRGDIAARVEAALTQAALWPEVKDRLRRSSLELSGGQQQRLCIARAIALEPEILLLDEPCASLDPISTAKIEELLLQLRGRYTMIVVTHNLAQAKRISERAAFFWCRGGRGELIEEGETAQLFEAPTQPETRDYVQGLLG